jgi:UDP-N-acetylmuramyl pentapeptide phosphotransferase/UDP-N-acetylglucosamine-1-phosphate transferase
MIPLLDTLRVFGIRILHRRSPFSPDRNHIHHILLDRGFSHQHITFSLALAGSLAGFLCFNFSPAKIFMGDTGSLLIGLVSSIIVIKFINVSASTLTSFPIEASPAVGFAILMIPLLDTLRVFGIRIIHRRSPFSPDRNHVHHILLDRGYSHQHITFLLVGANLLFIALAYFGRSIGSTWMILTIGSLFFAIIGFLYYTHPKRLFVSGDSSFRNKSFKKGFSKILLTKKAVLEEK